MTFNKKTLFILSALSAVLMILAFPMLDLYLFAFIAFIPMSIIIYSDISLRRLFFSFAVFVFIFFGALLLWVASFMLKATPVYVAIISLLFILISLSIFYTITAKIANILIHKFPNIKWLILPACFAILEYMRTVGFLGFPWGLIGYSQWKFLHFIQISDLVGAIGVGFVLYFVNAVLADMIICYRKDFNKFNQVYLKFPNCLTNNFMVMVLLLILIFAYGIYQINGRYHEYKVAMRTVDIGLIQKSFDPNHRSSAIYTGEPALTKSEGIRGVIESFMLNPEIFDNKEKPDGVSRNSTIGNIRLTNLAREASLSKPSMIVFCETATSDSYGYYIETVKKNIEAARNSQKSSPSIYNTYLIYESVTSTESYYLLGTPVIHINSNKNELSKANYLYYNGAAFINPEGDVLDEYGKVKLVPFGEAYPFKDSEFFRTVPPFSWVVNFLYEQLDNASVGGWSKWQSTNVFTHPRDNYTFSPTICYESAFGDFTRQFVKDGADIIILLTDDAWSYRDSSLWQHFTMSVFRAIENRRDVVNNANSGITGHIDAFGNIVSTMEPWEPGYSIAHVKINEGTTIYTKYGEWLIKLLAIFIAVLAIIAFILFIKIKIRKMLDNRAVKKKEKSMNKEIENKNVEKQSRSKNGKNASKRKKKLERKNNQ